MPNFRLQSKKLFLTYPQCNIDKEIALDLLKGILTPFDPSYIVVSSELHEDGHPHLHALAVLNKKYDSRQPTCLDLTCPATDVVSHGNYQGARDAKSVHQYVTKDDNFIEHGNFSHGNKRTRDEAFSEALSAASREEAEEIIRTKAPRDYAMGFGNISKCLDKVFKPPVNTYESPFVSTDFDLPDALGDWLSGNFMVCIASPALSIPLP